MTANCYRVADDSLGDCVSEEVFPLSFRNKISSDGFSAFAPSVGKYRPVSHADTDG